MTIFPKTKVLSFPDVRIKVLFFAQPAALSNSRSSSEKKNEKERNLIKRQFTLLPPAWWKSVRRREIGSQIQCPFITRCDSGETPVWCVALEIRLDSRDLIWSFLEFFKICQNHQKEGGEIGAVAVYLLPRIEFINCCCNNKNSQLCTYVLMRQHSPPLSPRLLHDSGPFFSLALSIFFSSSLPPSVALSPLFPYVPWPHWTFPFLPFSSSSDSNPLKLIRARRLTAQAGILRETMTDMLGHVCLCQKLLDKMMWKLALWKKEEWRDLSIVVNSWLGNSSRRSVFEVLLFEGGSCLWWSSGVWWMHFEILIWN